MLAKGFMLKRVHEIVRESGTYFGYNSHSATAWWNRPSKRSSESSSWFWVPLPSGAICPTGYGCRSVFLALVVLLLASAAMFLASRWTRRKVRTLNRTQAWKEILQLEANSSTLSPREFERLESLSGVARVPGEEQAETLRRMKRTLERLPRYEV